MLKKILGLALVLAGAFLFTPEARAQYTTVSATIHDPSGIPYANGTVSATLFPASPGGYTLNGRPYSGTIPPAALDSTGSFTVNFGDNGVILPAGSQWLISVNSNPGGIAPPLGTGQQSFQVTMTITGATQNISTTLNAAAPALTHFASTGGTVSSVSCGNLVNVFTCSVANPTTTPGLSFLPVLVGPTLDCSAQPGAPDFGIQVNNCLAALATTSEGTGIADVSKFASPQNSSTQIVDSIGAMIYGCALLVNENAGANIELTNGQSSLVGCPAQTFIVEQNSNVDAVVATGTNNAIWNVDIEGQAPTFTGNGLWLNGTTDASVKHNIIETFSADLLKLNSTTRSDIDENTFNVAKVHTLEDISGVFDNFHNNRVISGFFETGDTIVTSGSAVLTIADNYKISNGSGATRILTTCVSCQLTMTGNGEVDNIGFASTQEVLDISGSATFSNNNVKSGSTGGAAAVHMLANGLGVGNTITTTDGNGFVMDGGTFNLTNTSVSIGSSSGTKWCGVEITGDNIGSQIHGVSAGLDPTHDVDAVCVVTSATHMLNILVDGVSATGFSSHGFAFNFNNTFGANTNIGGVFENITSVHTSATVERTDAQNNKNTYINISSDGTLFAAGGSTRDVFYQNVPTAFANLPANASIQSIINCSDCGGSNPVTSGGSGVTAYRTTVDVSGTPSSQWMSNPNIVGMDTHTAEITGNYGAVTLLPTTAPTGSYLVTIYVEVSTAVATSTVTTSINYADDAGATSQSGASFSGATLHTQQSLTFPVRFVTGTALTYSTSTANSPKYKIIARAEAQ